MDLLPDERAHLRVRPGGICGGDADGVVSPPDELLTSTDWHKAAYIQINTNRSLHLSQGVIV